MYLLGYDIGSSSVKASLVDAQTGVCIASDFSPKQEMEIIAHKRLGRTRPRTVVGKSANRYAFNFKSSQHRRF